MLKIATVTAFLVLSLSACQTIMPVNPAGLTVTPDRIQNVSVSKIDIQTQDSVTDARIVDVLSERLKETVPICAVGTEELTMTVRIDGFKDSSTAATILLGDAIVLSALIEFREPETGTLVAEYYNDAFHAGGGLLGALALSSAHKKLSKQFANNLCKHVFNREPPKEPEDVATSDMLN